MADNNDNNDNNKRVLQLEKIQKEARDLFSIKNKDYGNAFAAYGPVGVLVRIGDKVQRLQSINKSGITLVKDEKIRDTLIDLHNYAAMAIMLLDEPKKQEYKSTIIIAEAGCGQINIDPMSHLPPV